MTVKNLVAVRTKLTELLDNSVSNIVFDMENCREIDSSGLGILSNLYKKLSSQGGELGMLNIQAEVQKILNETGLSQLIKAFESLQSADDYFD